MNVFKKIWLMSDACYRLLHDHGLAKSIWRSESVDCKGNPLPWLSYPAIHFLDSLDLSDANIFEFGSGNSTLYWMQRYAHHSIKSYQAVELSWEYYKLMQPRSTFYADRVRCVPEIAKYIAAAESYALEGGMYFDVTVVDGHIATRHLEFAAALKITDSEGLIVVDDANWLSPQLDEACNRLGMFRVDFVGFSPGVSYSKITSVLFRNPARFFGAKLSTPVAGFSEYPGQF